MVVIAWHLFGLQKSDMPRSRKRIRTANGLLMLFLTALLAYALSILKASAPGASTQETRAFVMVWLLIIGLIPMVIALAGLDVLNTARLNYAARRGLRRGLRDEVIADALARAKARGVMPAKSSEGPGTNDPEGASNRK
jgi:hypothetical protein